MDDQEELTSEQEEQTAERAYYQPLEDFATDTRNIRFVESRENWRKLIAFVTDHDLPVTAPNLRFAYLAVGRTNWICFRWVNWHLRNRHNRNQHQRPSPLRWCQLQRELSECFETASRSRET